MERMNQGKKKTKRSGAVFFRFLPGYAFRFIILLPLLLAFVVAFLAAWPFWLWEYLHQKKDYIR